MILSALALWKKYDTKTFLNSQEWGEEETEGKRFSHLHYSGHQSVDGLVRIYAQFCKPTKLSKCPAILLLPDAEEKIDRELMAYFADKGYAVLVPDYAGKMGEEKITVTGEVIVSSIKNGEQDDYVIRLYNPKDVRSEFAVTVGSETFCGTAEKRSIISVGYRMGKFNLYTDKTPV